MDYFKHENALVSKKAIIGDKTRIWAFANIQDGARIGNNCNICDGCFIEGGAIIGNNVTLKNGISVFDGVVIEDDVFCGGGTIFVNDKYPRSNRKDPWELKNTSVKKGATIGSNATILCGITIREYACIGAGSVVTKDVPPYCIVVGNPARPKGYACCCGHPLAKDLKCSCGLSYLDTQEGLKINE